MGAPLLERTITLTPAEKYLLQEMSNLKTRTDKFEYEFIIVDMTNKLKKLKL